mmetsp:Transcript_22228/g.43325  ORF Transcript_22228/g.43325 Transcript_22228/m.43325 type:complete len:89 (+) Transcript_22228:751-1017(+)
MEAQQQSDDVAAAKRTRRCPAIGLQHMQSKLGCILPAAVGLHLINDFVWRHELSGSVCNPEVMDFSFAMTGLHLRAAIPLHVKYIGEY